MNYFNPLVSITLDWRVMKGLGKDPENFYGSDVKLFLCGRCNVFPIAIDLTRGYGHVIAEIPAGMPEDVYGVHLLWSKNDKSGFGRCMMRTEKHDIFCLDSSVETRNNPTIEIQTTSATYGYDGLSAYELAVLLGKTSLDRNQWVENAAEANANVEELRQEVEQYLDLGLQIERLEGEVFGKGEDYDVTVLGIDMTEVGSRDYVFTHEGYVIKPGGAFYVKADVSQQAYPLIFVYEGGSFVEAARGDTNDTVSIVNDSLTNKTLYAGVGYNLVDIQASVRNAKDSLREEIAKAKTEANAYTDEQTATLRGLISAEEEARSQRDTQLQNAIQQEVGRAAGRENALALALQQEAGTRAQDDNDIMAAVSAERARALGAEGDINTAIAACFNNVAYDSTGRRIVFKHGDNSLYALDATPFLKDGMIESVYVEDGYLVISFNTESGKEDVRIPLSDIFDPEDFYTKAEVNALLAGKQNPIGDLAQIRAGAQKGAAIHYSSISTADITEGTLTGNIVTDLNALRGAAAEQEAKLVVFKDSLGLGTGVVATISTFGSLFEMWFVEKGRYCEVEANADGSVWTAHWTTLLTTTEMETALENTPEFVVEDPAETPLMDEYAELQRLLYQAITDAQNAKADIIGADNFVYHWNAAAHRYERTTINVKGDPGTTDYNRLYNTPTTLSHFEDDLGDNPVHDHASLVNNGSYNSLTRKIELKHGNIVLATIDASEFVRDGMVSNVMISGGNLVIVFNTDAGGQSITIPLTMIFNPANYYNKTAIDEQMQLKANVADLGNDIQFVESEPGTWPF